MAKSREIKATLDGDDYDAQPGQASSSLAANYALASYGRHGDAMIMDRRATVAPEPMAIALTDQNRVGTTYAGAQFAPSVAALPGGAYVIAWLDSARGAVYGQLYDSGGQRVGGEFQVGSPGPSPLFPSVAALEGGGFVIAWQYGSFSSADIHAQRYSSTGSPIGTEFTVNSSLPNEQLDVRIVGLDGGGFVATWDTIAGDAFQEVSGRLFNAAGDPIGPDFTVNSTTADSQGISSIAPQPGGGFVVTWQSVTPEGSGHVLLLGQRYGPGGARIGGEFQINTATANNVLSNDVTRLSDGGFVVAWIDPVPSNGGGRVVARHYDAIGNAVGGEITIASKSSGGFANAAVTALADGAYVVAWTDKDTADNNVSARAMGANDAPLGAAFDVSSGAPFSSVLYPDGAITLANGQVVFTWDGPSTNTSEDVYYRMYKISAASGHYEGDPGDNNFTGSTGGDVFDLSQGGNDIASGLDGDDAFFFGAAFTAADQVDGGAGGNDQIGLQGNYTGGNALTLGTGTIAGIEAIVVLPGFSYDITTVDANVPAGGLLSVQATQLAAGQSLTFNGAAETDGRFMIFGGNGSDHLTGGAGDDGFYFGPGGFDASDVINGGGGANDQIGLDGNYGSSGTPFTLGGNFSNIEVVVLLPGPSSSPNSFHLAASDALVAAGQTMTIFGTQVSGQISFDGAAEHDGVFKIYGGLGADALAGGTGADWIFGGNGVDTLTGGAGNDIFYYDAVAQSIAALEDHIADFSAGDRIDLHAIDAILGGGDDAFSFIGAGAFTNHAGELRAVNGSGSDWTIQADTDGDGIANLQILVHVSDSHAIIAGDFVV